MTNRPERTDCRRRIPAWWKRINWEIAAVWIGAAALGLWIYIEVLGRIIALLDRAFKAAL